MKFRLSGAYGELSEVRNMIPHRGIDLDIPENSTLRSIADGVVTKVFDGSTNIGEGVAIKTKDGLTHLYGHMNHVEVHKGETIHVGDIVGKSGNTGHSTAPHLHFGIQKPNGEFIDPTPLAEKLSDMSGHIDKGYGNSNILNWLKERGRVDQYSESAKNGEHPFWNWIQGELNDLLLTMWNWFIISLPDIVGYITIVTGIMIIFSCMVGKDGMLKVFGWYSAIFILAVCILGGAKG